MSLESAIDEEMREVMNLLEGRPASYGLTPAPAPIRTSSPVPQVRSMLDIGPAAPRHGSIAGVNTGITPSPLRSAPLGSSMLDPYAKAAPRRESRSPSNHHRTMSAAATDRPRVDHGTMPFSDDQFDMSSTVSGPSLPKRVKQGGRKGMSSMASIIQGQELEPIRGSDRLRHNSTAGIIGHRTSSSPSSRLNNRSQSPGSRLNSNSFNPMPTPGKYVSDSGKVIDLSNAYRKLSDGNLLKSGSSLVGSTAASRARLDSGTALSPTGEIRLQKDYYEDDENEGAIESSDDNKTSDEEAWGRRGRERTRKKKSNGEEKSDDSDKDSSFLPKKAGKGKEPKRVAGSLLAAAEEERVSVSSRYHVKSLLEPAVVTVTGPGGEKITTRKTGVHPNTNYNAQLSRTASPTTSDTEEVSDIRRAQKLSITTSQVDTSIPHRAIRTIIRGEFSRMQHEAEEGHRRVRTYLVATDLSSEAAYALEWTIGTVLRDGDTLQAVYAVDEEVGTGKTGEVETPPAPSIGHGAAELQAQAVMHKLTEDTKKQHSMMIPSPLSGLTVDGKASRPGSQDTRHLSKHELERSHAVEDISQTCIKFLRKTKLQVRITVEVIHCKTPKHILTEAIDTLEPTLVILGSRGRSALKGVLLGSFSNYLVTKSSVPVMVARKKLQKPNSKSKGPNIRLANNLTPSGRLQDAIID